jgi:beta-galactosidase/beta-glucuronidase
MMRRRHTHGNAFCALPQALLVLTVALLASAEQQGDRAAGAGGATAAIAGREVVKFDFAWRFKLAYQSWRPKLRPAVLANASEASADFDDASWAVVDAPHDFLIGLAYNRTGDETEGAFLPRGEGWYRKHFALPSEYRGRIVWLYFEGVWQQCLMWLNGVPIESGNHSNGYTSFADVRLDNHSKVNFGSAAPNVLAVHVNALKGSGWWYEGGGIYRHVNLVTAPLLHFSPDGVFAPATVLSPVSNGQATKARIDARATVANYGSSSAQFAVRFDVFDTTGKKVATAQTKASSLALDGSSTVSAPITVAPANLWSTKRPYLYTVKATILSGGADGDSVNETIGIYTTSWTPDSGFYLNAGKKK